MKYVSFILSLLFTTTLWASDFGVPGSDHVLCKHKDGLQYDCALPETPDIAEVQALDGRTGQVLVKLVKGMQTIVCNRDFICHLASTGEFAGTSNPGVYAVTVGFYLTDGVAYRYGTGPWENEEPQILGDHIDVSHSASPFKKIVYKF